MEEDKIIRDEEMPEAETDTIEDEPVTDETAELFDEQTYADSDLEFDELLEESLSGITDYQIGDKVNGEVINITDSLIFISLGGKRDAYAEKGEFADRNGKLNLKVGDKLEGFISKYSDTETCISPSLISVNIQLLREAYEQKIPVAGKVLSTIKGGFLVDVSGIRGFCPLSQISNKQLLDYKKYLSNTLDFRVIDFTENGKNVVLSHRLIIEENEKKMRKEVLGKINVGDIVKGKVCRLTNFGAFVELGGIEGLLHISEFSHNRVESPSDMVSIGDEVEAKIIRIKGEKVSLSFKAMLPDPTEKLYAELQEGDILNCRVLRNLPFGSFVEIQPGVEGLIPISEMDRNRRVVNANEILKPGDMVEVQVLRVRPEERKISLSLKALQTDPWLMIDQHLEQGEVITGKIENVTNFGAFIRLKDGITGLLPNSKIKIAGLKLGNSNVGEEISVRVSRIDPESRRISLEPESMPEAEPRQQHRENDRDGDWRQYKQEKKNEVDDDNPFNVL